MMVNMNKTAPILTATVAAALILGGCSGSGSSPASPTTVASVSADTLQMNVGTANLAGTLGTNVAVTYRQVAGQTDPGGSAVLVSSPTLTVPNNLTGTAGGADSFGATILTGPASGELGTKQMLSLTQAPGATGSSTFGIDGGAFGLGLEPFNYVAPLGSAGVTGTPANVVPYPVPVYDPLGGSPANGTGTNPNSFIPAGGPPAFNLAGNVAATQAGFNGISEGLDVFALAPAVGTYTVGVSVPANTGTVTATASAAITTLAPLPLFAPPVATLAASGALTVTYVLPAGVTEAYIQVTDYGPTVVQGSALGTSCVTGADGAPASLASPVYYTIQVTSSGTSTLPAGSICTAALNTTANAAASDGDAFVVQGVGFDYPAFEASYPSSLGKPAPSLTGSARGTQADLTVSAAAVYNSPIGSTAPVVVAGTAGFPVEPAGYVRRASSLRR
jgi:hypothetical protein